MIEPSIDSLLKKIDSKYSLVAVSAQRARELQEKEEEDPSLHKPLSTKLVGVALEEIQDGKLKIKENTHKEDN